MKTVHMSLSVRGALSWPKSLQRNLALGLHHDDGSVFSVEDLRTYLMDALAAGYEVIPLGDCPGFDPKKGCPGHSIAKSMGGTK
jgi:hypothetical protein